MIPAGEIPGYPVERDSETGRVYTSATGERVFDQGKQQILGTVDGKVRGLNMRVAQVKKSLTSEYDTCAAGHRVVFDFDSNKRDLSHAENKLTGERTYFKFRNRVWEIEVNIIPKAATEDILTKMQEQNVEEWCPFEGQVLLTGSPIESTVSSGPVRDDREWEGRGVMAEATTHNEARGVPVGPTRQEREDHNAAGHVPYPELVQGMCGWTRSKRCTPDVEIDRERNHNDWYRLRVPGR